MRRLHDQEEFGWGDIVMLFRARTGIEKYDAALRALGVPTVMIGGNVFAEQEQVADVLALLALVENPHDEEPLVRVLASPYVAASDDDLLALREAAGPKGALWDAVERVPALREFGEDLRELRARRPGFDLGSLVEECLRFRDYELAALGLADGPARYANLRRLVLMAERYGQVRGADVRGFLRFMARAVDLDVDPGEAVVIDEQPDAVRLMTVHGAKGQEFPAVVLADCANKGAANRYPAALVSADGRVGIRARPDGLELENGFDVRRAVRRRQDARRARGAADHVCGDDAGEAAPVGGRAGVLEGGRHARLGGPDGMDRRRASGRRAACAWRDEAGAGRGCGRERAQRGAGGGGRGRGGRCASAGVGWAGAGRACCRAGGRPAARPARELLRARTARGVLAPVPPPGRAGPCGDRHGHRWERRRACPARAHSASGFHEAIEQVDWRAPVLPWDDERAQKLFGVIRDGELGTRLAAAVEVQTEWPFLVGDGGAVVEGVADVWAREPDGTVLIADWKTGTLHGPDDPGTRCSRRSTRWLGCARAPSESRPPGAMWRTRARLWWGGMGLAMPEELEGRVRGRAGRAGRGARAGRGEAGACVQPVSRAADGVSGTSVEPCEESRSVFYF